MMRAEREDTATVEDRTTVIDFMYTLTSLAPGTNTPAIFESLRDYLISEKGSGEVEKTDLEKTAREWLDSQREWKEWVDKQMKVAIDCLSTDTIPLFSHEVTAVASIAKHMGNESLYNDTLNRGMTAVKKNLTELSKKERVVGIRAGIIAGSAVAAGLVTTVILSCTLPAIHQTVTGAIANAISVLGNGLPAGAGVKAFICLVALAVVMSGVVIGYSAQGIKRATHHKRRTALLTASNLLSRSHKTGELSRHSSHRSIFSHVDDPDTPGVENTTTPVAIARPATPEEKDLPAATVVDVVKL